MTLNSRQEIFCRTYGSGVNGTLAAREAGYGAAGAPKQASRLLQNPDVAERIGEYQAEQAAARAEMSQTLIDKLEPLYQSRLDAGDNEAVLQVVELQARIAGLISGGSILPRRSGAARLQAPHPSSGHMEFLRLLDEEAEAAAKAQAEAEEAEEEEAEAEAEEAAAASEIVPGCL